MKHFRTWNSTFVSLHICDKSYPLKSFFYTYISTTKKQLKRNKCHLLQLGSYRTNTEKEICQHQDKKKTNNQTDDNRTLQSMTWGKIPKLFRQPALIWFIQESHNSNVAHSKKNQEKYQNPRVIYFIVSKSVVIYLNQSSF